jgi:sulfotransferase family protein
MKGIAAVCTHHKTGTVWMAATFRTICKRAGVRFLHSVMDAAVPEAEVSAPTVIFFPHSRFDGYPWLAERADCRLLHVIRDPRDVVISAMHYHRVAQEPWLKRPDARFDGKSYQEVLNALPDDSARYIFELNNAVGRTIRMMLKWPYYGDARSFECRYEDLIADTDMSLFAKVAEHLGFEESEIETCRQAFWENSLFGKVKPGSMHVRAGTARQWPDVFDRPLGWAFVERPREALLRLGYEPDDSWIEALPGERVAAYNGA